MHIYDRLRNSGIHVAEFNAYVNDQQDVKVKTHQRVARSGKVSVVRQHTRKDEKDQATASQTPLIGKKALALGALGAGVVGAVALGVPAAAWFAARARYRAALPTNALLANSMADDIVKALNTGRNINLSGVYGQEKILLEESLTEALPYIKQAVQGNKAQVTVFAGGYNSYGKQAVTMTGDQELIKRSLTQEVIRIGKLNRVPPSELHGVLKDIDNRFPLIDRVEIPKYGTLFIDKDTALGQAIRARTELIPITIPTADTGRLPGEGGGTLDDVINITKRGLSNVGQTRNTDALLIASIAQAVDKQTKGRKSLNLLGYSAGGMASREAAEMLDLLASQNKRINTDWRAFAVGSPDYGFTSVPLDRMKTLFAPDDPVKGTTFTSDYSTMKSGYKNGHSFGADSDTLGYANNNEVINNILSWFDRSVQPTKTTRYSAQKITETQRNKLIAGTGIGAITGGVVAYDVNKDKQ